MCFSATADRRVTAPTRRPASYAEAALSYEADAVATAKKHTRNDTLNRAAFNLGQLVASGLLTAGTVTAELTKAGLEAREIPRTIRSGLTAGERNPRKPASLPHPPSRRTPHQRGADHVPRL